jgi:hypothetical protein
MVLRGSPKSLAYVPCLLLVTALWADNAAVSRFPSSPSRGERPGGRISGHSSCQSSIPSLSSEMASNQKVNQPTQTDTTLCHSFAYAMYSDRPGPAELGIAPSFARLKHISPTPRHGSPHRRPAGTNAQTFWCIADGHEKGYPYRLRNSKAAINDEVGFWSASKWGCQGLVLSETAA